VAAVIGRLDGRLLEVAGMTCLVDCGGVGYEVTCSAHTIGQLAAIGERVVLRVFTQLQDNQGRIVLYGFASSEERELFDLLVTVQNVGPTAAVKILSAGLGPEDVARLIAGGQVGALTAMRGVGKKTAERLVVELRDPCEQLLMSWAADGRVAADTGRRPSATTPPAGTRREPVLEEVASALLQLGWRPAEVDKALATLEPAADASLEGLLRQALRAMPR
jgi:holliday junction DNA helicase RuvA